MNQSKWALVVGIDRYVNLAEKYQLRGCVNDARLMKQLLIDHYHFTADNIVELHNEQATRAAMLAQMDALVGRIGKDDIVVFHYSGHGSRRTSSNPDESSGKDSTLITHDSGRRPHPNLDITDDEIREWVERLAEKTRYITMTFDCCHSGTITRDAFSEQARSVEDDLRTLEEMGVAPRPAAAPSATRNVGASGWLPASDSYVVISGCRDTELSHEFSDQDNDQPVRNGALTRYLSEALLAARPGSTYRDVFEKARFKVTTQFPTQHPQIEGALDREIMGVRDIEPVRFVAVARRDGAQLTLAGGAAHGLMSGSRWGIYPPGTKTTEGVEALTTVEIDAVGPMTATGRMADPDAAVEVGCRCVQLAQSPRQFELRLDLSALDDDARATMTTVIEASPLLAVADSADAADMRVYVLPPRADAGANDPLPQLGAIDQPSWAVVDREGESVMPLRACADPDAMAILTSNLEIRARFRNALMIDNPGAALNVAFNIYRQENDKWILANDGESVFEEGDVIAFDVVNNESRPIFVSVLDFDPSGKITQLYPPNKSSEPIEPGKTLAIGTGEQKIRLAMHPSIKAAQCVETFKAFLTTDETDFTWLQQEGTRSASASSALQQLFSMAYHGPATRAASLDAPNNSDDWVTISRPFILCPRAI